MANKTTPLHRNNNNNNNNKKNNNNEYMLILLHSGQHGEWLYTRYIGYVM